MLKTKIKYSDYMWLGAMRSRSWHRIFVGWGLYAILSFSAAGAAEARSIFLNGIDVSSARNQTLKNVEIKINENGDIFIIAPHYQVNEEETYTPLSRYMQGKPAPLIQSDAGSATIRKDEPPAHQTPNKITEPAGDRPADRTADKPSDQPSEKVGSKTGP